MKKIEDMTIQEMVSALNEHNSFLSQLEDEERGIDGAEREIGYQKQQIGLLTRAIDKKCEEAGIRINYKGQFEYDQYAETRFKNTGRKCVWLPIPAADQHALEGYLLSKNT